MPQAEAVLGLLLNLKRARMREIFCSFNNEKHEFQKQRNGKLQLHSLATAFLRIWSTLQIFNYSHLSALVSIAENNTKVKCAARLAIQL